MPGNPANSAGVDLNELQTGVIDHCLGLNEVVTTLPGRERNIRRQFGNTLIPIKRHVGKGFFQPIRVDVVKNMQSLLGTLHILLPDGPRINHEVCVGSNTFSRGNQMGRIVPDTIHSERCPSELYCLETRHPCFPPFLKCLFRCVSE